MKTLIRFGQLLTAIALFAFTSNVSAQDGGIGAGQTPVVTLSPDQFGNVINIQMATTQGRSITFELRNAGGSVVFTQAIQFAQLMQVNTSTVEPGQYTARVIGARGKVIIEKPMERMADE